MGSINKICRICFNLSSTPHITRSQRNQQSFKRFCNEINCKDGGDEENVTICEECLPLVESVSRSKLSVEEMEEDVLRLQKKLLKLLNEFEEELSNHCKRMGKLEEVVKGSSPQPGVMEGISLAEIGDAVKFRKGILGVAKDLRSFRTDICRKIMAPVPSEPEVQEIENVKFEVSFSPPGSPAGVDDDPQWLPEDEDVSHASPPQRKSLRLKNPVSKEAVSESESEDEAPPVKRQKDLELPTGGNLTDGSKPKWTCGGNVSKQKSSSSKVKEGNDQPIPLTGPLEYVKSLRRGDKEHLVYEGYRYIFKRYDLKGVASWGCCFNKKLRCNAGLKVATGSIISFYSEHNHSPESAEVIERKKRLLNLKETCLTSQEKTTDIVAGAELGDLEAHSVKKLIWFTRRYAKSPLKLDNMKDIIYKKNPEIFLMNEFMQKVVTEMIRIEEMRRLKKSKCLEQFGDPRLNHNFRFDWNEKQIFLGEVEVVVDEKGRTVQCSECDKKIGPAPPGILATQIFDHIIGEHLRAYNCTVCAEEFMTFKAYEGHMKKHLDVEVTCDICGRPLMEANLERHRTTHMNEEDRERQRNEKSFTCTICGKGFTSRRWIRTHEKTHDKVKTGSIN